MFLEKETADSNPVCPQGKEAMKVKNSINFSFIHNTLVITIIIYL